MIDIIFLLIIFFILAGRITDDLRHTEITVPPTKTAQKIELKEDWTRIIIEAFGSTQTERSGMAPVTTLRLGGGPQWRQQYTEGDIDKSYNAYIKLRDALDQIYLQADYYDDPNGTGMKLPKVSVEIRADANTEYRVVQEIQQLLTDTIAPEQGMMARPIPTPPDPSEFKPFVNIEFTTRLPGDEPAE